MKLTYKIPLIFILIGFGVLSVSFYISYSETKKFLAEQTFQHLTSSRESKKREIESYFRQIESQLVSQASNLMTIEAVKNFSAAFKAFQATRATASENLALQGFYQKKFIPRVRTRYLEGVDRTSLLPKNGAIKKLQYDYIVKPNQASQSKQSAYHKYHARYHPAYEKLQKLNGYYDIFVIDLGGNVVYSVFKEVDFATNLLTGPHHNSGLATAYRQVMASKGNNAALLIDFEPYVPSYGAPAAFIATTILENNKPVGVLAFQIPIDRIDMIMTSNRNWKNEGYGNSGESYIVAGDFTMRNNSRFLIEEPERYFNMLKDIKLDENIISDINTYNTSIYFQKVKTGASIPALQGVSDTRIVTDYRGIDVLSSYTPLNIPGVQWALLSEIDVAEAFNHVSTIKYEFLTLAGVLFFLLVIIAVSAAGSITSRIANLVAITRDISRSDFSRRLPVSGTDEISDLTAAFNSMSSSLEVATVSNDYTDNVINAMGEALFVMKSNTGQLADLRIQTVNKTALKMLEMEPQEVIYRQINQFMTPESGFTEESISHLIEQGELPVADKTLVSKSGRHIPTLLSVSTMPDRFAVESSMSCVCMARDISDRKLVEEKLKLASAAVNNSTTPILIVDRQGAVVDFNPAFEYTTGLERKALYNKSITDLDIAVNETALSETLNFNEDYDNWRAEVVLKTEKNGNEDYILSASTVLDANEELANHVLLFSDIGELKDKQERIQQMANHDALTGLPNRALFNDRLSVSISNAKRNNHKMAVLYMDLDGFKPVNDTHGHQAGDELLIDFARLAQDLLRESDTIARVGGDEFVIIINEVVDDDGCLHVADKVLNLVRQPFDLSMATVNISVSIGIAIYPQNETNQDALVKAADNAMYTAKKSGKNKACFYHQLGNTQSA